MSKNVIFAREPRACARSVESNKIDRTNDAAIVENYLTDESRLIRGEAKEVYFPRTEEQVSQILNEMNKKGIRVSISGAGTGITGSRVPLGGIVLSTEKMTLIHGYDFKEGLVEHQEGAARYTIYIGKARSSEECYAIAPPGIPINVFKKLVETENLYYPPDPTETTALLGGTIATNASGARTFKYGPTRNYVRRLRIVLCNGDVLDVQRGQVNADCGGKFVVVLTSGEEVVLELPDYTMPRTTKHAAGYYVKPGMDLIDVFIGSEGTLGVISEAEVRLLEKPKPILPIFAHFVTVKDALDFSKKLREESRLGKMSVVSIECFEENAVNFIKKKYPSKFPERSRGIIFFELEITNDEEMSDLLEYSLVLLENNSVLETMASLSADWEKEAKDIRHAVAEQTNSYVKSHGTHKIATDIAVSDSAFDEMIECYRTVGNKTGIPYVYFGHIGDNHIHFNFLPTNIDELERATKACTLLLEKAIELGGTISGEHGVGKKTYIQDGSTKAYLEILYGKKGLLSSAKLKNALDPKSILNVGTIVPFATLEEAKEARANSLSS